MNGSASTDPENSILSYAWSKISGPSSFNIVNPNSMQTNVTNLSRGAYQFELTVTDAGGLFSKDTMMVTVNINATNNLPPISIPGNDTIIYSTAPPCTSVSLTFTLDGSNSYDPDGNIVSYLWTGPGTIANPNSATTTVSGSFLEPFEYALKVTDNNGTTTIKYISFTVLSGNRPVINATMTPIGTLSRPRGGMGVVSAGGKIFFAGGYSNLSQNEFGDSRVDIFDIATNTWSTAELSVARHGVAAVAVENKVFFAGGHTNQYGDIDIVEHATVDIYDVSTNTWSVAALSEPRGYLSAVSMGNKVFFAGGYWIEGPWTFHYSKTIDIYDLSTNTWSVASLSDGGTDISAVACNNKVYFAGGFSGNYFSNKIDIYDNATNSWSVSTLTESKSTIGGIAVNNKIYWAGGSLNWQSTSCKVEIRDVNTQSTIIDFLSHPSDVRNAVIKDNKIAFANLRGPFDILNLNSNTWSTAIMPLKRDLAAIISVNNIVYIAGGWAYENQNFTNQVYKLGY